MGAIAGLLGLGGGQSGTGVSGNTGLQNVITPQQIAQAQAQAQSGIAAQQALNNQLQGAGVQGTAAQRQLISQLQQQAAGGGPNPALAQLAQATGQNTANTAALMASQRGAAANPGLIARQAAQQGAANQQAAAGQAATLAAQQQLAAQQNLANVAGTTVGQQQQGVQALNQAAQGNQGQQLGALASQNQANLGANQINAGLANMGQKNTGGILGGALNAVGGILGLAEGGEVPAATPAHPGVLSTLGAALSPNTQPTAPATKNPLAALGAALAPASAPHKSFSEYMNLAHGGNVGEKLKKGGTVPGKAVVKGDSLKNDNVKALLSPKEIVLPRSVTMSQNPGDAAKRFVEAIKAKQGLSGRRAKK